MTALTSVGTDAAQDRSPRESRQRHDLAELGRLLALVIVAAAFRFPYLGAVPPGFQFDETYNALDALRIVEGARPIFLPANAGREVLFSYVQAPFVAALGPSAVALRLPSALFGTATVLLLYLFVRLWRPGNIRLAWFAGLALAIMYPHLHFSRYAIRSISIPFWLLPTLGALWIGLRDRRPLGFVCCGVGMAAMVWTHPVGRLIPFVVAAPTLYLAISRYRDDPKLARDHLVGLASAALVAMILFAPLARYYWRHPAHFVGHASDVSVLADRVSGGDVWGTLVQNALRLAGMFCVAGDREWIHNLPGRPILDPLMSVFSVVGLIAVARRFWARRHELQARGEAALLGAWFTVLLVPSLLSDMAPNFSRTIGLLPLVAIVVAVGLDAVARWLDSRGMKEFRPMVLALALVLSAAWTAWDYFVLFGRDAETPDHYDRDKIEAAQLVRELDRHDVVFMAPLWAQQSTIQLLTRDLDMRSVETDVATVFPRRDGARGVVYAFPPEQESLAEELAHRWPAWAQRDVRFDSRGRELLHLVRFPSDALPYGGKGADWLLRQESYWEELRRDNVRFGGAELIGHAIQSPQDGGATLTVTLVWQCIAEVERDLTTFVHLVDRRGQRVAQADARPGRDSYSTDTWHVGDLVVDTLPVELPPCMPAGDYSLEVGWYELCVAGMPGRTLRSEQGMSSARIDRLVLDGAPLVADDLVVSLASEARASDVSLDRTGARLVGYALHDDEWEIGQPALVSLYWTSHTGPQTYTGVQLALVDTDGMEHIISGGADVGPGVLPDGQGRCRAVWVRAEGVQPGRYQLAVVSSGEPSLREALTSITLLPSSRVYTLPDSQVLVGASLHEPGGGAVRLHGFDVEHANTRADGQLTVGGGQTLAITLHWQVLEPLRQSYKVFLHLVDGQGTIVAQRDVQPRDGRYPTHEWVADEVVSDRYTLDVPDSIPVGAYGILVGLYDSATGERLEAQGPGALPTGTIRLAPGVEVYR